MSRRQGWALILSFVIGTASSACFAGVLNGHPDAFGGWTGTAPFDNGNNLSGTVDYSVFTAADFNANFAGLGYVPGDAYVYTYQVLNRGSDNFSSLTVGIDNPANTIGTFDIGDVDASSSAFDGSGNAEWQFLSPFIATGEDSWGLAFSSPNIPEFGIGIASDGGGLLQINDLPTPSNIPEPSTVVLVSLATGFGVICMARRRS